MLLKTGSALLAVATSGLALANAPATTAPFAGRWSQSSQGKELVLVPRIKLQPNFGVGAGTSLGGSVGYGSMTRTAIVTEPVPMDVARSMTLVIGQDGRFDWTITRRHAESGGCTRTTVQHKQGNVQLEPGQLLFAISGGTESWRSSCGKQGSGTIAAATERYAMTFQGQKLLLASGPSRWTFSRG
ncbi:MAG: hypothetical protein J7500_07170 [Sphingomonas sp.]|uniref:hypothetical protein n=1 Tax=Sphingomonas sp. TaxID=28214 RepID=UPI001B015AE5|nr:hypothetical protein [Sphingomonas sp.]MBO9622476.1 hypothetical protein [Sphingomonas sp.]